MGIEKYEIVMIRSDTFNVMIQYFYAMGKDELCVLFLYLQPGGTVLELCRIPLVGAYVNGVMMMCVILKIERE